MQAVDESIIIETKAKRAGEELVTEGGIVLGRLEMGEIPEIGTIISIGNAVPENLLNKRVLIPNGRINHVVDPRIVAGEFVPETERRQLVATHWKNIQVIY